MGYRTPNIDPMPARALFTDYWRRTKLHWVRPGRVHHRPEPIAPGPKWACLRHVCRRPTRTATALGRYGYATGQFGKNHLGDRHHTRPPHGSIYSSNLTNADGSVARFSDPEFRSSAACPAHPGEIMTAPNASISTTARSPANGDRDDELARRRSSSASTEAAAPSPGSRISTHPPGFRPGNGSPHHLLFHRPDRTIYHGRMPGPPQRTRQQPSSYSRDNGNGPAHGMKPLMRV